MRDDDHVAAVTVLEDGTQGFGVVLRAPGLHGIDQRVIDLLGVNRWAFSATGRESPGVVVKVLEGQRRQVVRMHVLRLVRRTASAKNTDQREEHEDAHGDDSVLAEALGVEALQVVGDEESILANKLTVKVDLRSQWISDLFPLSASSYAWPGVK